MNQSMEKREGPAIVLDAGALLFDKPFLPAAMLTARKKQAETIMAAMNAMRYSAIGISAHDLAAGGDFLVYLQEKYRIPFVSMNLARRDGGTVFKPYIIKTLGESSVAVLGLTGIPESFRTENLEVLSWQDVLPEILKEAGAKAEIIILLSSCPEQTNREIAALFPSINLILQSSNASVNKPPEQAGNALISQTAHRGKYVAIIDISWNPDGKWQPGNHNRENNDIHVLLERVEQRLTRMEKRHSSPDWEKDPQYRELRNTQNLLLAQLAEQSGAEPQNTRSLSTYSSTFTALATSLPQDPEVRRVMRENK